MKRVIELLRVSTDAQARDTRAGLPAQRAANRRTAEQYGLEIVETVELIDVSGAAILYEPAMQRLLREIARPDIEGVVCREFSRLMRPNNYADYKILERFVATSTLLYLPEGPLNFGDKMGKIVGTMQGLIAGLELDTIKERMMSGKEALRRKGLWAASERCLPYGVAYNRATGKFSYKPEAELVRRVFKRFLAGETNYATLAKPLRVNRTTVPNLLTNPIYTGWLVYNQQRDPRPSGYYGIDEATGERKRSARTKSLIRDRRKIPRAAQDVIRVRVMTPGLVTEREFQRVASMIASKAQRGVRERKHVGEFTYNGLLWCAKCGARVHTFRNQLGGFYYLCSNKKRHNGKGECLCPDSKYLNRDRLEAVLNTLVSRTLADPKVLRRVAAEHRRQAELASNKSNVARLNQHLDALIEKRARVVDNYTDGLYTRAQRDSHFRDVEDQLATARDELARVTPDAPRFSPEELAALFAPFAEWDTLSRAERRRMLLALQPAFHVDGYRITGLFLGDSYKVRPSPGAGA